jgi:hypothetical protein
VVFVEADGSAGRQTDRSGQHFFSYLTAKAVKINIFQEEIHMKNMRKLTALLLAVVMVLSLSIAVFARDGGTITNATINGETATISTTNYITATLNGTTAFSASEYSLRNATISFTASAAPTATGVTFTAGANNTYTATGVDLFNKCLDVTVDGTVYHFAAGLKNGTVDIDDADPLKVVFTIEDVAFTNNAYNVQNPNIGTSEEPDGWTGIAYTVRGTLPAGSNISALAMTVEKNNADATVSGSCVTSEGGDDYTLNLSGTDKMITVTYDDMTRNYYVAATVTDSGKINVTIMIDASNADVAYPTQVSEIDSKMGTASGDNTGYVRLEIDSGKTVYDALVDATTTAGITIGAQNSSYGVYVYAIGGIGAGGRAGWMYSVNGAVPMVGAASYVLTDGDEIIWYCVGYK